MKFVKYSVLLAALVFSMASAVFAQGAESEWSALNKEVTELYRAGKHDQAVAVARQALEVAQNTVGPEHPDMATSLNNLALLYTNQGQYAQAEPLYKRALAISEKTFGPDNLVVAVTLSNLAGLYRAQGQYALAESHYKRSLAIRERVRGADHTDLADGLNNLAGLYRTQGDFKRAEMLYKRALTIWERAFGSEHLSVATGLDNLAVLYLNQGKYEQAELLHKRAMTMREKSLGPDHPSAALSLSNLAELYRKQGKYKEAEQLFSRSLAIEVKAYGPNHPRVAAVLNNLAECYREKGRYELAEPLYNRSLSIREQFLGPNHPEVAVSLNNLALLFHDRGDYVQAESHYNHSLSIREKALGPNSTEVAGSLQNLAALYDNQGQYTRAEAFFKRSLAIDETALGLDHPDVAMILHNLAVLHYKQGQFAKAEPLFRRSLAIREKAFGPDHPDVAGSLNNLAKLYRDRGQYADAELLYMRSLAIRVKVFGPDHPTVATNLINLGELFHAQLQYVKAEVYYERSLTVYEKILGPNHPYVAASLNNLAMLYENQGKLVQAEPLHKRALAIAEKAFGPDHPDVAGSLNNLAGLYLSQGQYAQADPLYKRALAINEKAFGQNHPAVALSLNNLAWLYEGKDQLSYALGSVRRSSNIYRQRILAGGQDDAPTHESTRNRNGFVHHLALLSINPDKEPPAKLADESLQIAQLEQASSTGAAVAKMAIRFARGDDAIASLVKRKQDATERRARGEANLVKAAGQPPEKRNAALEEKLREDIVRLGKDIDAVDVELTSRFPEYQELTRPEPLSVIQVQAMLRPNEAMLVYAIAEKQSWLWVVRADRAEFILLKTDQTTLAEQVKTIRGQMEVDKAGRLAKVDVARLHELYQSVFTPAVPHLAGIQHLMLVPAGPLQSLPFGLLVASSPKEIQSAADYRYVDWLIKHYALSVLPSVSSIRAFRQFNKSGAAQAPFIGFGDPLLTDERSNGRAVSARVNLAGLFRDGATEDRNTTQSEIADVKLIKQQTRLPETADELRAMAKIVKAGPNSIWLQDQATETNVKKLDLTKYRTLAFATHGVMAGELGKDMEPGLILTPPVLGTVDDDGYLTASEIAKLKLNADWVLLSACNTAAADGSPGAEGMSGLAKAFFYAGSRSLLVSHWLVASEATVPLTTFMLREYEANPRQGKAEAHRKAMLELMNTPGHPEYAHPMFWAPFVVVGEGGAGLAP